MRLIELTGLPGSGKSKILPIVRKYFSNRGLEVYDKHLLVLSCKEFPLNKIFITTFINFFPGTFRDKILALFYRLLDNKQTYIAHYLLENWKFSETILNNISESPFPSYQKNWLVLWWFNIISLYQMGLESLQKDAIILFDEGFYHKVINFFVHLKTDLEYAKIECYVKGIPNVDILIHVETSLDKCLERLKSRKLPRVIRGSRTPEVRSYLEKSREAIQYSQKIICTKGTKIVKIENSSSPFSQMNITDQLANELSSLI
ncbi:MAG: hypothetical protein O6943_08760 [Bacteroidetes bacterium]|nr:hypothetical protein [Bacteroidota bacterium]